MFERAVQIDGVLYRHHEAVEIIHEKEGYTYVKVRSTAGAAVVMTQHEIAHSMVMGFSDAEQEASELDFFKEVEDPYAEVVEEQAQLVDAISDMLTDEQAVIVPDAYREWQEDVIYPLGKRVRYNKVLYKCLQAHTSQIGWEPGNAPSLWAKVLVPEGDIPVWEQPDSTNPYMKGDKVHYPDIDGPVYESTIDNNVYSPEAYPQGWQLIDEVA